MAEPRQLFVYESPMKRCVFTTNGGYSTKTQALKIMEGRGCPGVHGCSLDLTIKYTFIYDI